MSAVPSVKSSDAVTVPPLSRQVRLGDLAGAAETQNRGVELALSLAIKAADGA